jgi:hypothetical protein
MTTYNFEQIAAFIAGLTLVVTNLAALYKAVKNSGMLEVALRRLDDHSRRIDAQGDEINTVALATAPPKK